MEPKIHQNIIILIMGTSKRVPLILGNPQLYLDEVQKSPDVQGTSPRARSQSPLVSSSELPVLLVVHLELRLIILIIHAD